MRLPNAERAVADIGKLRDYSLNPDHEVGKHKARVFKAILGLTIEDAEWLRAQTLRAAKEGEAMHGIESKFGEKYVVDVLMWRGQLSAKVRTTWIIETGADFPRLTSCYVLKRKGNDDAHD